MPAEPAPVSEARPSGSLLDELLTTAQVAQHLQMRTSTIEDYARRGLLPSLKLGRHRRYLRSHIEQAIQELATPPAPRRLVPAPHPPCPRPQCPPGRRHRGPQPQLRRPR